MKRYLTLSTAAPSPPAQPAFAKVPAEQAGFFGEDLIPAAAGVRGLPRLESA